MLSDQDIKNLRQGLLIKEDLKPLATKEDIKEIATDLANLEDKVDHVAERIEKLPEELPILIARAIGLLKLRLGLRRKLCHVPPLSWLV